MITKKKKIASTDFRTVKFRILLYLNCLINNLPIPISRPLISPRMRVTSFLMLPISFFSQITSSSSIRRCFLHGRDDGPG